MVLKQYRCSSKNVCSVNVGIKEECEYNMCYMYPLPMFISKSTTHVRIWKLKKGRKQECLRRTFASESDDKGGLTPFPSSQHIAKMPLNLFFQLSWLSQIKMKHNLFAAANKMYCLHRIELSSKNILTHKYLYGWTFLI